MDDKTRAQAFKTARLHAWPGLSVDSSDLHNGNLLTATGDSLYAALLWSADDCPVGSVPIGAGDLFRELAMNTRRVARRRKAATGEVGKTKGLCVKRCLAHQITDCFDCKNPVQSTQDNPQFECVEVPNGHE